MIKGGNRLALSRFWRLKGRTFAHFDPAGRTLPRPGSPGAGRAARAAYGSGAPAVRLLAIVLLLRRSFTYRPRGARDLRRGGPRDFLRAPRRVGGLRLPLLHHRLLVLGGELPRAGPELRDALHLRLRELRLQPDQVLEALGVA